LGKVAVLVDGLEVDAGPDRQRCVLVGLAVDAGRVVSVDRLIERVWGDEPPLRARATLLSYLSRLRHAVPAVVRRPGGYVLEVDPAVVDLHRFRTACARARSENDQEQARLLDQALTLWQGEALTGLSGDWAAAERDRMQRERLAAEYDLTNVLLRLGHGEDLVAGLAARADASPLDERVAGQYILALHRAGRTADALARYQHVHSRLVEDLGCDPGPALQELHQQILAADPALTAGPRETLAAQAPVPRQLPATPAPFVGRRQEMDRLDAALNDTSSINVISAIAGVGGIGKTLLALHWAHRTAERFPDGQLFVDLRGFSPGVGGGHGYSQPVHHTVQMDGMPPQIIDNHVKRQR
jgi:DNA-binding SARP family transcriptional activator